MRPELEKVKNIIFDLDDTLCSEELFFLSGISHLDEYLANEYNIIGFAEKAKFYFYSKKIRSNLYNVVLDDLNYHYTDEFINLLVTMYRTHPLKNILYPESLSVLEKLKDFFELGLITDGPIEAQKNKVMSQSLNKYFKKIIYTWEKGKEFSKPHPISYIEMETYFGGSGDSFIYLGDNLSKDFYAANKRGWKTIQIQRSNQIHKFAINNLGQDFWPQRTFPDLKFLLETG